jgi:hypothetical protein
MSFHDTTSAAPYIDKPEGCGWFVNVAEHLPEKRFMLLLVCSKSRLGYEAAEWHRWRKLVCLPQEMSSDLLPHKLERRVIDSQVMEQMKC